MKFIQCHEFTGTGCFHLAGIARASFLLLGVFLLQFNWATIGLAEIQVEGNPRWGLDGKVQIEEFNLLRIEIFNNSEKPWQGDLWLQPLMGFQGVDVPQLQADLFLEPYGKRQLQFYVSLPGLTDFDLKWGRFPRSIGKFTIDAPQRRTQPLRIEVIKDGTKGSGTSLPSIQDDEFPSSVIVLKSLETIVLDHAPRWQEPQARAFRDWLYQGGELILLADSAGEYPEFSQVLAELNEPSEKFPVGYGSVTRSLKSVQFEKSQLDQKRQVNNLSTSANLFSQLRSITTPEHNWALIYFLSIIYLLILFPGCWLLGRKKGDFRITYAVILLTVGLFSFGFHTIGKRGYGEETTINCMTVAHPGAPGRWVVKQWMNLFVTDGDTYTVDFEDDSSTVSTGQHSESVRGIAVNQPVGILRSAVPSFSNRTILHAGVVKHQGFRPTLKNVQYNGVLQEFELNLPDDTNWPEMSQSVAVFKDRLYTMSRVGQTFQIQDPGKQLSEFLNYETLRFNPFSYSQGVTKQIDETFDRALWAVIADDLGIMNDEDVDAGSLQDSHVHVYFSTQLDSDFYAKGEISPQQRGRVVYAFRFDIRNTLNQE